MLPLRYNRITLNLVEHSDRYTVPGNRHGDFRMKKLNAAVFLGVWLLAALGCSSTPSGTIAVGDLLEKEAELLGQEVVVVGRSDIRTSMSTFNMFKIYNREDNVWVKFSETESMPPQGQKIRVNGTLKRQKFTGIPEEQLYIEAVDVSLE
jgi:hypothetical protein